MAKKPASTTARVHHWLTHTLIGRSLLGLLGLFIFGLVLLLVWFQLRYSGKPTELGVSFSTKYAEELGLDWQDTFLYTVDDLDFRYLRLMSYWDDIEPENNQFDFTKLDWQMDQAAARGVKVNLAMGERQPRWPECHHPDWIRGIHGEEFNQELYSYIGAVTDRYKNHPALEAYQLENEIFNTLFGECEPATRERVQTEYDIIKAIDPIHPVGINVSNQSGIAVNEPIGDQIGFSMYRKAYGTLGPFNWYFNFWYVSPLWHTARAAVMDVLHDVPMFIHELQTEPWGPEATVNLSIEEQNKTMTPEIIRQQVRFAEQTGMNRIYLWGTEWWYWRLLEFNDASLSQTVQQLVDERSPAAVELR
jgi:hypothetical protein